MDAKNKQELLGEVLLYLGFRDTRKLPEIEREKTKTQIAKQKKSLYRLTVEGLS